MAVKIVRLPNKIAVLGAPTSAAALSAGHEKSPTALRASGLIDRLKTVGFEVVDLGDDPPQVYKPDDESPRARNLSAVVASLEALKPRVEQAIKLGALPLILSGDCSVAIATIAGAARYFRHVGLIYMDRDADLNTPATTRSGSVDGMVISHLTGRGAPELVRLWGDPHLIREPDLALFGVDRLDPTEEELLSRSPIPRYLAVDIHRTGAATAAQTAVDRVHGKASHFVLHLDVDVIADFRSTNYPGSGGLSFEEVQEALEIFVKQDRLAAIDVAGYNPSKDTDGRDAEKIVNLITVVLEGRLQSLRSNSATDPSAQVGDSPAVDSPALQPPDTSLPLQAEIPEATSDVNETVPMSSSPEAFEAASEPSEDPPL